MWDVGRKGEKTRDHKPSSAGASPPATTAHDTPIVDSAADQTTLLQRLPAAQAQELLQRTAALQGNRHATGIAGGVAVQRAVLTEEQTMDLIMDGVQAFEALAGASVTPGPDAPVVIPPVPANTPGMLRPALGHLREAKEQRGRTSQPVAEAAVATRLGAEGPLGVAKMIFLGPRMILDERLARAYAAKAEWQTARPACKALVDRYSATPGSVGSYAEAVQDLLRRVDLEMTQQIPALEEELVRMTSPGEAQLARELAEAKESVSGMERFVDVVGHLSTVGEGMQKSRLVDDVQKDDKIFFGDQTGVDPLFDKGVAGLKGLKGLIAFYESGQGIGKAVATLGDDKAGGLEKAKAGIDLTTNVLTPLQETGGLLLKGSAKFLETVAESRRLMGSAGGSAAYRAQFLKRATYLEQTAHGLEHLAEKLEVFEKVTGVLGVITGGLSLIEGVGKDDAEAVIGGALDIATGVTGLVAEGAVSSAAGIGALQVRGMLEAVAQMSRSLQVIRNQGLRQSAELVAEDLTTAGLHARIFDEAFSAWAIRQGTTDELERSLGQQFGNNAVRQADPLQVALHNGILRALDGGLRSYPVLIDEFCGPFGGYAATRAILHDLETRPRTVSTGELASQAEFLKEVLIPMRQAVGGVTLALGALDREAKGKVEFAESARNTFHVTTRASLGSGPPSLWDPSVSFEGPIDDDAYKGGLAMRTVGKTLGEVRGFDIEIVVHVANGSSVGSDRVTLKGSDDGLLRNEGLEAEAARTLWSAHLNTVKVPEETFAP